MPRELMPDRRTSPRVRSEFAAKVFHVGSRRWLPARTCDTSAGGTLIIVKSDRALLAGDEIEVIIAPDTWSIATQRSAVPGTVVRAASNAQGEQFVAVQYRRQASIRRAA